MTRYGDHPLHAKGIKLPNGINFLEEIVSEFDGKFDRIHVGISLQNFFPLIGLRFSIDVSCTSIQIQGTNIEKLEF